MLVVGGEIYWLFGGLIGKIAKVDGSSGYCLLGDAWTRFGGHWKFWGGYQWLSLVYLIGIIFTLAGGWKKFYFLQRHPTHFTNQRVKLVTSLTLPPNQRCHFIPFRDDFTKPLALL